jgi:hypothetical protein
VCDKFFRGNAAITEGERGVSSQFCVPRHQSFVRMS